MHQVALLRTEVSSLRKSNEALSKRKRAKRTRIQLRGSLTVREAHDLIGQKAEDKQLVDENRQGGYHTRGDRTKARCCGTCGKPGHNSRTCQEVIEASDSSVLSVIKVN